MFRRASAILAALGIFAAIVPPMVVLSYRVAGAETKRGPVAFPNLKVTMSLEHGQKRITAPQAKLPPRKEKGLTTK